MSWNSIKRSPTDVEYSKYIRAKAKGKCEYCGKICEHEGVRFSSLEASHYFSRSHWSVRFDDRNVHALCGGCHKRMGGYTNKEDAEYDLWIKKLLGENGYKILKLNAYQKSTDEEKFIRLDIKQKMKELNAK